MMGWLPGWTPDAESSGFQSGLRGPWYPPWSPPAKHLLLRGYSCILGWIPTGVASQKIALTLAMRRASPPSIRFRPERNRKTMAWRLGRLTGSGWTPVQTLGSTTASIPRPFALAVTCTRLSRAYPIHTRPGGECLAFRCLMEKCLTCSKGLDRPTLDPCCRSPMFPV